VETNLTEIVHNRVHASIHAEHLEEAALLHEHRRLWLEDPSLTLHDLAELEERLEAHLDGLVVGTPQTLALCERAVAEGDGAELHVGVRIACRCDRIGILEVLAERLGELDEDERGEFETAAGSALGAELPSTWAPLLANALGHPSFGPVVAKAIGRRRSPAGPALLRTVAERGPGVDPRYVRALGELRHEPAGPHLRELLGRATTPRLWSEVAIACLALGDREVAALVANSEQISAWSPVAQALVFDVPSTWLCAELERRPAPELLTALALRGDPSSLAVCVDRLADNELGEAAAAALTAITGAPLLDDASPTDDEDFTAGPTPARCRDPERWISWLDTHANEWRPGSRYRLGHPCTPALARASSTSFSLSLELRAAVRDELAIRHGELAPDVAAPAREQLAWFAAHSRVTAVEVSL
jgi:hypothetical protein